MKRLAYYLKLAVLALFLGGCAVSGGSLTDSASGDGTVPVRAGTAPIPGGYWMYSFGPGQTQENLENIEIAQSYYGIWSEVRSWTRLTPGMRASATRIGLQAYYPLHVRWKLKDGREFILENIDTAALMREYFKTHKLQLQWQREGRPQAKVGEGSPLLAHEVKDDTVILKWVITINRTPVNERLTPTGAANYWDTYDEEHVVAVLKGIPTSGIDFRKTRELL